MKMLIAVVTLMILLGSFAISQLGLATLDLYESTALNRAVYLDVQQNKIDAVIAEQKQLEQALQNNCR